MILRKDNNVVVVLLLTRLDIKYCSSMTCTEINSISVILPLFLYYGAELVFHNFLCPNHNARTYIIVRTLIC
jgi:hypothetical protein